MKSLPYAICGLILLTSSLYAGPEEKIRACLLDVCSKLEQHSLSQSTVSLSSYSNPLIRVDDAGFIQVYIELNQLDEDVLRALRGHDLKIELIHDTYKIIQGWLPFTQIESVSILDGVRRIRNPSYARTRTGSVNTEGDTILKAPEARAMGFTGSGVKVGVLSDGLTARQSAIDSGDLPTNFEIGNAGFGNEGVALLEIIHDLAPGASLAFSAGNTSMEFIASITQLRNFDCKVIVDDLGFPEEPFFEDGLVAQAAQAAVDAGIFFCSSAGNEADGHYEADFAGIGQRTLAGQVLNDVHDFGGGDFRAQIFIPANNQIEIHFQWNNAFGAAGDDYNLYLFSNDDSQLLASSTNVQNGNDNPQETLLFGPLAVNTLVNLVIERASGNSRRIEFYMFRGDLQEFLVSEGSIFGHAGMPGVFAVGAISANDPDNDDIQAFSGRGPSEIFFPAQSRRDKPQACGIDDVTVSGAGGFAVPFRGTSAAAPHIAAIAALLLQANSSLTPAQLTAFLRDNAVDLGAVGFDFVFGGGRVDALASLNALQNSISAVASGGGSGGGGCFLATAAYGTHFNAEVRRLRRFRDQHLLPSTLGSAFVHTYYVHSPHLSRELAHSETLRCFIRSLLCPLGLKIKKMEGKK